MRHAHRALVMLAVLVAPLAAQADPGILFEIDASTYTLRARDRKTSERGPELPVTLGSPANETPRGGFRPRGVIRRPGWVPSTRAQENGAAPMEPGTRSPMGVAKIPLTPDGTIALHGGGTPLLLGKPASGGCVRLSDQGMLYLLDWMDGIGALGSAQELESGSIRQLFLRPVRVSIH